MNLVETVILSGFDVVMLNLLSYSLLKEKIKLKEFNWIIVLLFMFLIGASGYYISNPIIIHAANAVFICTMFWIIHRKTVINTLFLYIISMVLIGCIQLSVAFLIKVLTGNILNNFTYGIIAQIIGLLLTYILYRYAYLYIIYDFTTRKNKVAEYLLINSFLILIFIAIYWYIDLNSIIANMISIFTLSISIIFINFVILRNGLKNQFETQELKIYKTYLPVIEQLMDDIRARQHEFDNHLQALRMIRKIDTDIRKDDIDELIDKYCTNIIEKNKWNYLIKLNNKMLAGFLYSKILQAGREQINIEIKLNTYFMDTKMKDYELIEVTGILINNAFEAVKYENEKKVIIKISKEKDMNVVEVRNKHPYLSDEIIQNMFKRGFSTKQDSNSGYGLNNLQSLINKYNGKIEVFNEDEKDNYVVIRIYFM